MLDATWLRLAVVCGLCIGPGASAPLQGDGAAPARSSRIAFVSARDGDRDIYLARADGERVERLTVGGESTNDMPRWSPDGSRLAIQVAHGKNYDIDVVSIADRRRVRLADTPAYDGQYAWSPDRAQLAFVSDGEKFNAVYVANADGSNPRRLTGSDSLNPAWWR